MSKYRVAAKDPCVLVHLQKVLGELAAQLMHSPANGMEKCLVVMAAFNTYCPQRYCISIALGDRSQMFPVPKPAQVSLRGEHSAEVGIDQQHCRKSGTSILLEAKGCYAGWLKRLHSSVTYETRSSAKLPWYELGDDGN